jgi:hypothetical protein
MASPWRRLTVLASLKEEVLMLAKIRKGCLASMCSLLAVVLIGGCAARAQQQYPTAEIPTAEPAYIAKVKTAAPEQIVNKASIVMMQA